MTSFLVHDTNVGIPCIARLPELILLWPSSCNGAGKAGRKEVSACYWRSIEPPFLNYCICHGHAHCTYSACAWFGNADSYQFSLIYSVGRLSETYCGHVIHWDRFLYPFRTSWTCKAQALTALFESAWRSCMSTGVNNGPSSDTFSLRVRWWCPFFVLS